MGQEFRQRIGQFVRERRKAGGFSQHALGDLAGVGRRFVSELEQAKPTVRLNSVNKVLAVFGKTLGIVDAPKDEAL
jgi:y4mF family transcriptional regulator